MIPSPERRLIERVLSANPPLELGGWAADRAALELVLTEVAAGHTTVVECGSGTSTVAIARLLRELDSGHVWALEHEPKFAVRTRAGLAGQGLEARATVIEAPLRPHPLAVAECGWYEAGAVAKLPPEGIDLLFVDGPPAPAEQPQNQRSRYPAVPLLAKRLGPGAAIVCDDAERAGERWALDRWERDLGLRFERLPHGLAIAREVR